MTINKKYIIEKQNILNEMRSNNMTLQEIRFLSIYLSKINARDISTRKVTFSIEDFQKLMELKGNLNIQHFQIITNRLLSKVVNVPTERGGYVGFQLFKKCTVDQDEYGKWFVEIDAHDEALTLIFDFKTRYFTYQLWNALRLKSTNQVRMYEILKQYEKIGVREISLVDLRKLLGINSKEYPRWSDFKIRVIDSCQQALLESTDIKFTYEPIKKGRGGKITALKFTIEKNDKYIDKLTLDEYLEQQPLLEIECEDEKNEDNTQTMIFKNDRVAFLSDACDDEFSEEQIEVLLSVLSEKQFDGKSLSERELQKYNYLSRKYKEMNMRNPKVSRHGYLKKLIEEDIIKENKQYE